MTSHRDECTDDAKYVVTCRLSSRASVTVVVSATEFTAQWSPAQPRQFTRHEREVWRDIVYHCQNWYRDLRAAQPVPTPTAYNGNPWDHPFCEAMVSWREHGKKLHKRCGHFATADGLCLIHQNVQNHRHPVTRVPNWPASNYLKHHYLALKAKRERKD